MWFVVLLGCTEAPPPAVVADEDELDQLRVLGYVDYAPTRAGSPGPGLSVRSERAAPGHTLVTTQSQRFAELLDLDGNVVRRWESTAWTGKWVRSRLDAEGRLHAIGQSSFGGEADGRYLEIQDWDGELLEMRPLRAHHDLTWTPDGRLTLLLSEDRDLPQVHASLPTRDDVVAIVDDSGVVQKASLFDALSRQDVCPLRGVVAKDGGVDLIHANSVEWVEGRAEGELFAANGVLVSTRHQDCIVLFDFVTGEVRWSWGRGEIRGPHHASTLPDGHILLFDNGMGLGRSRVLEVDPTTDTIVWSYEAPEPESFYTLSRGSAQRLPNGNTLICDSEGGRAFEVTRRGEVVWDWRTPHTDLWGRTATLIRAIRYPPGSLPEGR